MVYSPMDLERHGNWIEAGVWFALAAVLLVYTLRSERRLWPTLFILAVTLAAFGASDVVEAHTGAWWRPWCLLVWKTLCVIVLLLGFRRYYQTQKAKQRMDANEHR